MRAWEQKAYFVWKPLAVAALMVTALMLSGHLSGGEAFFLPLYPGEMVGLLITGGHGGTLLEEQAAVVVSFAVNVLVYTLAAGAFLWTRRRLRS